MISIQLLLGCMALYLLVGLWMGISLGIKLSRKLPEVAKEIDAPIDERVARFLIGMLILLTIVFWPIIGSLNLVQRLGAFATKQGRVP